MFECHHTTASEAKAAGAKYYFNGRPCKRGHVALRYAHGSCVQCKIEDRAANAEKMKAYLSEWHKRNPQKMADYHAKHKAKGAGKIYYENNRHKLIEKAKAWAKANPEKAKLNLQNSRIRHLDERRKRDRQYYQENREQRLSRDREYRARNRELMRQRTKQWRQNNPEKAQATDRNKRLKRRGAIGSITAFDVAQIFRAQRGKCAWCRTSIRRTYHLDHIIPLSKAGTNLPSNAQLLCPPCSQRKHAIDPIDFAQREGRLL